MPADGGNPKPGGALAGMSVVDGDTSQLEAFLAGGRDTALLQGDAATVLATLPAGLADTCLTSPPYWAQRAYDSPDGFGREPTPEQYVDRLVMTCREIRRVLKPTGSIWLNLGDTYRRKNLLGIPWRVALALQADGWILRNAIIWDKEKGNPCNARDKLRNVHEHVFHLVRQERYTYDLDAIRQQPGQATHRHGRITTPTGVNGTRYERQIKRSPALTDDERARALAVLRETLARVERGEIADFRMLIRGVQRATHSDAVAVSGRAHELRQQGFCILPYHKNGAKPGDVWRITPEDSWRTDSHYAVFPVALCELPILATCPLGGIVLDPFAGTGTTLVAARALGRRALGIDLSPAYLAHARQRLEQLHKGADSGSAKERRTTARDETNSSRKIG
jgi:DNA modification methylase